MIKERIGFLIVEPAGTTKPTTSKGEERRAQRRKEKHGENRDKEEQEEEQQQEAETPTPKWPYHQTSFWFLFQAKLRCQRSQIRRPIHCQILHNPASQDFRTPPAPLFSAGHQKLRPPAAVPFSHSLPPHKLHNPRPPRLAHTHSRPRHQKVQSSSLCFRKWGHEGSLRPCLADGNPSWGSEQEADKRAKWVRDGSLQIQKRVHNFLCVCSSKRRVFWVFLWWWFENHFGVRNCSQGFLGSHRHARHAQPENHQLCCASCRHGLLGSNYIITIHFPPSHIKICHFLVFLTKQQGIGNWWLVYLFKLFSLSFLFPFFFQMKFVP